jgi:hypothetical protein
MGNTEMRNGNFDYIIDQKLLVFIVYILLAIQFPNEKFCREPWSGEKYL